MTTFEVNNSKDFFNYFLKEQVKEFFDNENYKSSRHAVICSMFAYHLREWLWKDMKKSIIKFMINNGIIIKSKKHNYDYTECKFNEYVNSQCPEFRYIREICNGTKHLKVCDKIKTTKKRNGGFNGGFNGNSFNTDDLIIIDNNNNILVFKNILLKVVEFWKDLFEKLKI